MDTVHGGADRKRGSREDVLHRAHEDTCKPRLYTYLDQMGRSRAVPRPEPHEPDLKVGIVLMTRRPHRFDFWLAYHRSLGISPFFEP